jgi:hypothetical protein
MQNHFRDKHGDRGIEGELRTFVLPGSNPHRRVPAMPHE